MTQLNISVQNDVLKTVIANNVEKLNVGEIVKALNDYKNIKFIKIDMKSCTYMHSKALSELIALKKFATKSGVIISLANVPEHVIMMLEITNLTGLFTIIEDFSSYTLDELCQKFNDVDEASKISEYLSRNYTDQVRAKLVALLDGNNEDMAEWAVITIGRAYDFESIDVVRKQLDSPVEAVRAAALLVLGWLGDMESKERIYEFLKDGAVTNADAAVASIALLSDESDVDRLRGLLKADDNVKKLAIQALTLIGNDDSYNIVVEQLKVETSPDVRKLIASQLGLFNKKESTSILIDMLDDTTIDIKEAAAASIAKLGAGDYVDKLIPKVLDEDTIVAYFAVKALARVYSESVISELIAAYPKVADNVKLAIVEVVSNEPALAFNFFKTLMNDDNEDIRKEALQGLFKASMSEALKYALVLIDTDPSWIVRYHAVDIIVASKPDDYLQLLRSKLVNEDNRYVREKIISNIGE